MELRRYRHWQKIGLLGTIPVLVALFVWFSSLAFVPVPWPDDSAFYFVGKEFFKWPPRWVMLPQAPFEPTYRIFNFNTMPLYPFLIGLGRLIGIDGSFLIKFWPLSAWALSGSLLGVGLYLAGLPFLQALIVILAFMLDPDCRWASVLVRPESLIGLLGVGLVLGLSVGFPNKLRPRGLWDPIAAILALGAYSHFNAIHLLFPVFFAYSTQPRRIIEIGLKTVLYLSPWLIFVFLKFDLFIKQMTLQWTRLAGFPNNWLSSTGAAVKGLFQDLGSPEPFYFLIYWASVWMWLIIICAGLVEVGLPLLSILRHFTLAQVKHRKLDLKNFEKSKLYKIIKAAKPLETFDSLSPAFGWILGAIWIWHTKPEVWFIYYLHISLWCYVGIALLRLHKSQLNKNFKFVVQILGSTLVLAIVVIFGIVNGVQTKRLAESKTWNWPTYYSMVDCVDEQLTKLEKQLGSNQPLKVWGPTFPDITIELSRKHPHWEYTRTNDFHERSNLAFQHGKEVDAIVVTEIFNWAELTISTEAKNFPALQSLWMRWKGYFLNDLYSLKDWKPNRYVCQRGRWQAFLFMEAPPTKRDSPLVSGPSEKKD